MPTVVDAYNVFQMAKYFAALWPVEKVSMYDVLNAQECAPAFVKLILAENKIGLVLSDVSKGRALAKVEAEIEKRKDHSALQVDRSTLEETQASSSSQGRCASSSGR